MSLSSEKIKMKKKISFRQEEESIAREESWQERNHSERGIVCVCWCLSHLVVESIGNLEGPIFGHNVEKNVVDEPFVQRIPAREGGVKKEKDVGRERDRGRK